jgi:hypothetical protein
MFPPRTLRLFSAFSAFQDFDLEKRKVLNRGE